MSGAPEPQARPSGNHPGRVNQSPPRSQPPAPQQGAPGGPPQRGPSPNPAGPGPPMQRQNSQAPGPAPYYAPSGDYQQQIAPPAPYNPPHRGPLPQHQNAPPLTRHMGQSPPNHRPPQGSQPVTQGYPQQPPGQGGPPMWQQGGKVHPVHGQPPQQQRQQRHPSPTPQQEMSAMSVTINRPAEGNGNLSRSSGTPGAHQIQRPSGGHPGYPGPAPGHPHPATGIQPPPTGMKGAPARQHQEIPAGGMQSGMATQPLEPPAKMPAQGAKGKVPDLDTLVIRSTGDDFANQSPQRPDSELDSSRTGVSITSEDILPSKKKTPEKSISKKTLDLLNPAKGRGGRGDVESGQESGRSSLPELKRNSRATGRNTKESRDASAKHRQKGRKRREGSSEEEEESEVEEDKSKKKKLNMFKDVAATTGKMARSHGMGEKRELDEEGGFAGAVAGAFKKETGRTLRSEMDKSRAKNVCKPERPFIYDPKSNVRNIFVWHKTAVKMVLLSQEFWVLMLVHTCLSVFYHGGIFGLPRPTVTDLEKRNLGAPNAIDGGNWPTLTSSTMFLLGSFLVFFLVFFNGQAYARFFQVFNISCKIRFVATHLLVLVRIHIHDPQLQMNIMRFVHSSMYLGYMYLPQNYELPGFVMDGYVRLKEMKTLSPIECDHLKYMAAGKPHNECLLWALAELKNYMDMDGFKVPIFRNFENQLLSIRTLFDDLESYSYQPIPFAYYHLVNWFISVYVCVLCYTAVKVTAYWSIIGYGCVLVAIFGLREASACLSDPLGLDETDIPIFDQLRDMHFQHVYCLTHLPSRTPTLKPILGYGSLEMLEEVSKGLEPHMYADEPANPDHMQEMNHYGIDITVGPSQEEDFEMDPLNGILPHYMLQVKGKLKAERNIQEQDVARFWSAVAASDRADLDEWRSRQVVMKKRKSRDRPSDDEEDDDDDDDDDDG